MRRSRAFLKSVVLAAVITVIAAFFAVFVSAETVIVAIDPGHGGLDGGTDVGLRNEKEYNLIVAEYMRDYLEADGRFQVVMTRTDDTYIKYLPRVMTARESNADVIISLHFNSNDASYVNGNMAYCSVVDRFDAGVLAGKLLDAISDAVAIKRGMVEYVEDTGDSLGVYYWNAEKQWDMPGAWKLGTKSDYYSINTWASKFGIPSVIVEHGYLSNPSDAALIDKDSTLRAMAEAQAEAIIEFYTDHEHNYIQSVDYPSNCTVSGTASMRCSVCGLKSGTFPLTKAPDGHYWRQTASAKADCTNDGYIEYVCQISYNLNDKGYPCEVHTMREIIRASGHSYTVTQHTEAAHGIDGVHTEVCQNCGDKKTAVTPGEPHSFEVTESIAPMCEENGKTVYTCTICGITREETHAAEGHNWTETKYVEPTATEDGYHEYTCDVCAKTKHVSALACRHDFDVTSSAPDCTAAGKTTSVCSLCGYETVEETPALGHDYVTQMDTEPGCTSDGFYKGKCSRCGNVVTETKTALGHENELSSETLTHRNYICKVCGEEYAENIRPEAADVLKSPVVIVIIALVAIQIIAAAAVILMHRKRRAEEEKKRRRFLEYYGESDAGTNAVRKAPKTGIKQ